MNALGYVRCSTDAQAEFGYGMRGQEILIGEAIERRGWTLLETYRDEGISAKTLQRPALMAALEEIAAGRADSLVVAKLDRLSRSLTDFARLLEWFSEAEANLVALDMDVDTSTPNGELMAHLFACFAQWERRMISQRTKDGLAAVRASGRPIGHPAIVDNPELYELITDLHACGYSYRGICAELKARGVPTVRGGKLWRPSAVQNVLGGTRRTGGRRREGVVLPRVTKR